MTGQRLAKVGEGAAGVFHAYRRHGQVGGKVLANHRRATAMESFGQKVVAVEMVARDRHESVARPHAARIARAAADLDAFDPDP